MKIITGMHRSGTSLVAQIFHLVGAPMGDPATFYPGDKWNPDGYFEQVEVQGLNMRLVNGPLGRASYFKLPGRETILRRGRKLEREMRAAAGHFEDCVVKDCRFCVTLPAWQQVDTAFPAVVVCLRHPYHVALSIKRRNKMPIAIGLKLWREHNERLKASLPPARVCYVLYERLLSREDGGVEARRALEACGVEAGEAALTAALAESIKVDFNHFRNREADEVRLPEDTAGLWEELLARHGAQS